MVVVTDTGRTSHVICKLALWCYASYTVILVYCLHGSLEPLDYFVMNVLQRKIFIMWYSFFSTFQGFIPPTHEG